MDHWETLGPGAFPINDPTTFGLEAGIELTLDAPYPWKDEVQHPQKRAYKGSCGNGVQDPFELGVDCGGFCKTACPEAPRCDDGIQNGTETGVDCGGSCGACECQTGAFEC